MGRRYITSTRIGIRNKAGQPSYVINVVDDVTERRRADEKIARLAHYDALTDLPNRVLFREQIERELHKAVAGEQFALLYIDIDEFKGINDSLGHHVGDELLKKLSNHPTAGLIGLCWMNAGTRNVYNSKKPIRSIEDLKGLKIRMMGNPVFVDTMNALGGNGVAMGMDQLVNAMQTGVVDGAENNAPTYTTGQHYRHAKYYSLTGHLMIPEILVFSKKTWSTLAQDDQALIAKLAKEAQQDQRKLWYAMEEKSTKQIEAAGIEIVKIDDKRPFQAAVKPVWDKYGAQHADLIKRIQDLK